MRLLVWLGMRYCIAGFKGVNQRKSEMLAVCIFEFKFDFVVAYASVLGLAFEYEFVFALRLLGFGEIVLCTVRSNCAPIYNHLDSCLGLF